MKSVFKIVWERLYLLPALHFKAYKKLIWHKNSFLHSTGWMRSLKEGIPIDSNGDPLPWMNFSFNQLLKEKLTKDLKVFEFGSGYSTLFFSGRVYSVTSIEYNKIWLEKIKRCAPENVKLIFKEKDVDGSYCRSINYTGESYDVVLIDGRDRVNCFKHSIPALSQRGVIIFDDSSRDRYLEVFDIGRKNGFKVLNIEGLQPKMRDLNRTSLFYRDGNCLGM